MDWVIMCKRQNNYKPDNKREKRGDIILLSETIMNSIDWQKSITKTLSNFEHIFNFTEFQISNKSIVRWYFVFSGICRTWLNFS
jgi:hypothetical protein